jgi:hypothetical protein
MFITSYFNAVCRDPGYLPFNWQSSSPTKFDWRSLMDGTAILPGQFAYVEQNVRPPGCSFSKSYGRFIIRGDHICGWISNWVGKRNHKHFLLMMGWGILCAISLFCWRFAPQKSGGLAITMIGVLDIVAAIIEGLFGLLLIGSFVSFCSEVVRGQTRVDRFKGIERVSGGWKEAMKEVCGDRNMWCWLCPTDAFPMEIELVDYGVENDSGGE